MVAQAIVQQVVQAGKEVTAGTLVAATHVVDHVPGTFQIKRQIKKIRMRHAGSFAGTHRSENGQETVEVEYTAYAAFDRLPVYGNLFLSPVTTGSGNPAATWTHATINDTDDDLSSYSFEVGGTDHPSPQTVAGLRGKSWEIDIKQDAPWEMKVGLVGMLTTVGATITPALSLPSNSHGGGAPLRSALGTQTKVYIDDTTIGSTVIAGTVVSANVKIEVGNEPRHTLDGIATPYRIALAKERNVSATVVMEYAAQTEYTAWAANTVRKVRIEATGATLGASNYKATLNIYGTWDELDLGEDNGVRTMQLTLMGQKDSAAGSEITATFINSVTALP